MSKPETKTVFVSILDGTDKETRQLSDLLQDVLPEHYKPVVTGKPVQAVSPEELMNQLMYIYNVEPGEDYDYITREYRILQSLIYMFDSFKHLADEIQNININIDTLNNALPESKYLVRTTHLGAIQANNDCIEPLLPKEGEKF